MIPALLRMIITDHQSVFVMPLLVINALSAISVTGGMGHDRDGITGTVPTGQPDAPGKALAETGITVRSGNSSLILTGARVRRLDPVGMNRE